MPFELHLDNREGEIGLLLLVLHGLADNTKSRPWSSGAVSTPTWVSQGLDSNGATSPSN